MILEDFDAAEAKFLEFVVSQGYPARLIWVSRNDVLFWRNAYRVRVRSAGSGREAACLEYSSGVARGFGVVLEAISKTEGATVCWVFPPADAEDAMNRMIPRDQVKLSVAADPRKVVLVSSPLVFAVLKRLPGCWSWRAGATATGTPSDRREPPV